MKDMNVTLNIYAIKRYSGLALVALLAGLFWFMVRQWLLQDAPIGLDHLALWLVPLIILPFLTTAIGFMYVIFSKDRVVHWAVPSVVALGFLLAFGFGSWSILAVVVSLLLGAYSAHNIAVELKERLIVRIDLILRMEFRNIILPIFIMVSIAYYGMVGIQSGTKAVALPESVQSAVTMISKQLVAYQYGGTSMSQQGSLERQITQEVLRQLTQISKPYFKYFPPIFAFGLFLFLWGFSFIFVWLSLLLASPLFAILKHYQFFQLKEKMIQAETIEI